MISLSSYVQDGRLFLRDSSDENATEQSRDKFICSLLGDGGFEELRDNLGTLVF